MTTRRRALVAAGIAAAACGPAEPPAGFVALPERSLTYAPLLAAARAGLYLSPPVRVATLLRSDPEGAVAAVVDGTALAAAMPVRDLVAAALRGAPLVAIGALTRRLAGHLVVNTDSPPALPTLEAALGGWRGVRVGLESGSNGTEQAVRLLLLARAGAPPPNRGLLALDPLAGEPRWIGQPTGQALVAALKDGRLDAFVGRSFAAAQALTFGGSTVAGNLAADGAGESVTGALCTVLVAHRNSLASGATTAGVLHKLVPACARAAALLAGPEGESLAAAALPERDALHLAVALRLDAPSPSDTCFATDGRVPDGALERYLELIALAGRRVSLDPGGLATRAFSG